MRNLMQPRTHPNVADGPPPSTGWAEAPSPHRALRSDIDLPSTGLPPLAATLANPDRYFAVLTRNRADGPETATSPC